MHKYYESAHRYYLAHKEHYLELSRIRRKRGYGKKILLYNANYRKTHPEKFIFGRRLDHIRERCNNASRPMYRYYGARGIKCLLTVQDLKFLWDRDKAANMVKPSIHRLDPDANYTLDNCVYIEWSKHSYIRHLTKQKT